MKTREIDILAKGLAPVVRQFVAQEVAPILLRVHALEAQREQLESRVRALENAKAVTPPSTPKTFAVAKLKDRLPVVRLSTARRRRVAGL